MNPTLDLATRFLSRAVDVLETKYPHRTYVGVLVGVTLHASAKVFGYTVRARTGIDAEAAGAVGYVAFGVLVSHSPSLWHFLTQRPTTSEAVEEALAAIEAGNFSDTERRQHYRQLVSRVTESVAMRAATEQRVESKRRQLRGRSKSANG